MSLTPAELEALFNILTHYQTFEEIRGFRYEANVPQFGVPFTTGGGPSQFPLLQKMMGSVVSPTLFTPEGWQNQVLLMQRMAAANLSDSYDKGFVGLRKEMATGLAATLESVTRGFLAGRRQDPSINLASLSTQAYDTTDAAQLEKGWEHTVQGLMYGDLLDRVFDAVKASPELSDVPPVMRAALNYFQIWYVLFFTPTSLGHHVSED